MRNVQERGNELATVLISTYLRDLHWCTTHLGTKVQLFYKRAKGRCTFHYYRVIFELSLSSIWDIMSFPIPSVAPLLCSSAKVVHQPLKVERSSGKPFRAESSSCWEYSARKILNQLENFKNQLKKPRHWFRNSKKQLRKVYTISSIIE